MGGTPERACYTDRARGWCNGSAPPLFVEIERDVVGKITRAYITSKGVRRDATGEIADITIHYGRQLATVRWMDPHKLESSARVSVVSIAPKRRRRRA